MPAILPPWVDPRSPGAALLHVVLLVLVAPLLLGIIARVKAVVGGRRGPPLLQGYFDLVRLWRKGMVRSTTTSFVFLAGPVVALATAVGAVVFVPLADHGSVFAFPGDVVFVAGLLALGRFLTTAAALDTGSAFAGMGAAREVQYGVLAEPAFLLGAMILVKITGHRSLAGLLGGPLRDQWPAAAAPLALVAGAWAVVLLAENSRIPFDDPNTHLELTMVHDVMILDHSGPALAVALAAAAVKLAFWCALVGRVALPLDAGSAPLNLAVSVASVAVVAVVVGFIESAMARLRLTNVPKLLVSATLAAGFGLLLAGRPPM
ncbi:MAG: hydrogenase [Myxococcales bacterium]|nr:hydrogenase [Myxococcales bacterium]